MIIAELFRHEQFVDFFEEVCDNMFIKENSHFYDKLGRAFFTHFASHINIFEVVESGVCCCHYTSDPCFSVGQIYNVNELEERSGKKCRHVKIFDQFLAVIEISNNENDKIFDNILGLIISYRNYNSKDLLITYNIYKKFQNYVQDLVLISKELYKFHSNDSNSLNLIKQLQTKMSDLLAMMNDLFDYKLLDYKKLVLNSNVTNLTVLEAFLKKVVLGKDSRVDLSVTPNKTNFKVDEQRFFQIIMNILSSVSIPVAKKEKRDRDAKKILLDINLVTETKQLELKMRNVEGLEPLQQITKNHEYILHYLKDKTFDVSYLLTFMIATKLIKVMNGTIDLCIPQNSLCVKVPVDVLQKDIISNSKVLIFNFSGTSEEKLLMKRFFIVRNAFICFVDIEDQNSLFDIPGEWTNTSIVIVHYPKKQNRVLINEAVEKIQSCSDFKNSKFICFNDSNTEVQLSLKYDYIIRSLNELNEVFKN